METVSVIIPTMDNPQFLVPCINSMLYNKPSDDLLRIIVVDNGKTPVTTFLPNHLLEQVMVVRPGKNLGWEGGLVEGLKYVPKEVEFVLFCNDDIHIPPSSYSWLLDMLQFFRNPKVGAVGPASNVVMGAQNIFSDEPYPVMFVNYLIGFCFLVRKAALEQAGGIDVTLPGGDDLDLSIRLRECGYKLVVDKRAFVYHHGFKTGERVRGGAAQANGWNSYEMYHQTSLALIKKHGFAKWQQTLMGHPPQEGVYDYPTEDAEGEVIRQNLDGIAGKVYDLGCGPKKTITQAIGVDLIPKGQPIATLNNLISAADIVADVSQPLPFKDASAIVARHILEHLTDPLTALRQWHEALIPTGIVILAVPDEDLAATIPMNKEHKHAFTKASMPGLLRAAGFSLIRILDSHNHVSFIAIGVKQI